MDRKRRATLVRAALILLACLVGIALFVVQAAGSGPAADRPAAPQPPLPAAGVRQVCYTIDTSRPEWLEKPPGRELYLPLVMRR